MATQENLFAAFNLAKEQGNKEMAVQLALALKKSSEPVDAQPAQPAQQAPASSFAQEWSSYAAGKSPAVGQDITYYPTPQASESMMGLIKQHEGFKTAAYADGTDNDGNQLYSIGYGNQMIRDQLSGDYRRVRKEDVIGSEDEALNASRGWINEKILPVLNKAIGNHKIDPAMHDVMVSLSYNIKGGAEAVVQSQFFAKVLAGNLWGNSDDPKGAMEEFEEFKHTTTKLKDGTVLKEVNEVLARRRNDEIRYLMDNSPYTLQAYQAVQENMQLESYSNVAGVVNVVNADTSQENSLALADIDAKASLERDLEGVGFWEGFAFNFKQKSNDIGYLFDIYQLGRTDALGLHDGKIVPMSVRHGKKWLTATYAERKDMENAMLAKEGAQENAVLQRALEAGESTWGMHVGEMAKAIASPTTLMGGLFAKALGYGAKALGAGKLVDKAWKMSMAEGLFWGGEFEALRTAAIEQKPDPTRIAATVIGGAFLAPTLSVWAPKGVQLVTKAGSNKVNAAIAKKVSTQKGAAKYMHEAEYRLYDNVIDGAEETVDTVVAKLTPEKRAELEASGGMVEYRAQIKNNKPLLMEPDANGKLAQASDDVYIKGETAETVQADFDKVKVEAQNKAVKKTEEQFPYLTMIGEKSKNGTTWRDALTADAKNKLSEDNFGELGSFAEYKNKLPGLPFLLREDIMVALNSRQFGKHVAYRAEKGVKTAISVAQTRLNNIDLGTGTQIQKQARDQYVMENTNDQAFLPFLTLVGKPLQKFWSGKMKGDKVSQKQMAHFFNQNWDEFMAPMSAAQREATENFRAMIDKVGREGVEVGWIDKDQFIEGYVSRQVSDYTGLQKELYRLFGKEGKETGDDLADFLRIKREEATKNKVPFDSAAEEEAVGKWMYSVAGKEFRENFSGDGPSTKNRIMPSKLLSHPDYSTLRDYYLDPFTATRNYLMEASEQITVRKLFPMYTVNEKTAWFGRLSPEKQAAELLEETGKKMSIKASYKSGTKAQQEKAIKEYQNKMAEAYESHLYNKLGIKKITSQDTDLNLSGEAGNISRGKLTNPFAHYLYTSGIRDQNRIDEAQHILGALYQSGNIEPHRRLQQLRSIGYAMSIGNIASAITQGGDLGVSMWVNGVLNTLGTTFSRIGRTARGKAHKEKFADVTRLYGMGKMGHEMATNFDKQVVTRGWAKAISLDNILRKSGFSTLDRFGKNVFAESAMKKAYRDVTKNNGKGILSKYGGALDGDEMAGLFREIAQHKKTGEVGKNLEYYVFAELLGVQPLAKSSVPLPYLEHPNARIFYQLKTWTIKQLDLIRNTAGEKYKRGDYVGGTQDFIKLALLMGSMNTSMDVIKDAIRGVEFDPEDDLLDTMVDNMLGQLGIGSRFASNVMRDGPGAAGLSMIAPASVDIIGKATVNLFSQVASKQGEEAVANNLADVVNRVPVVGTLPAHWWLGKAERVNKQKDKKSQEWKFLQGF